MASAACLIAAGRGSRAYNPTEPKLRGLLPRALGAEMRFRLLKEHTECAGIQTIPREPFRSVFSDEKQHVQIQGMIEAYNTRKNGASKEEAERLEGLHQWARNSLTAAYFDALETICLRSSSGADSPERRLLIDFGYFSEELLGGRTYVLQVMGEEISKQPDRYANVCYLSEWMRRIGSNEATTTHFMLQDGPTRTKLKERKFDKLTVQLEELAEFHRTRKSCSHRGRSRASTPVLAGNWIDPSLDQPLNTVDVVAERIAHFRALCPNLFRNKMGEPISFPTIIFPGVGYGFGLGYRHAKQPGEEAGRFEGRVFIPLLSPPMGSAYYATQCDMCVIAGLAGLYWSLATASVIWEDKTDEFAANYKLWVGRNPRAYAKFKGSTFKAFSEDFLLYMTKEANSIQALPYELRKLFWKYLPFPPAKRCDVVQRGGAAFARVNNDLQDWYEKKRW